MKSLILYDEEDITYSWVISSSFLLCMDARNVWASVDDAYIPSSWNKNCEANALTDRGVFRVFRDGSKNSNTYRVEPNETWWLRSIYRSDSFLYVGDGRLYFYNASGAFLVRPSKNRNFSH